MAGKFAENLAHALDVLNIKKSTLAITLGVSAASVSGWLHNKYPTPENLINISRSLNLSLDWLLTGNGPMHLHGPLHLTPNEEAILRYLNTLPDNAIDMVTELISRYTHAGTADDLIKKVRAENTLHSTDLAMIMLDENKNILDINSGYLQILNMDEDNNKLTVIGTSFFDWIDGAHKIELMLQLRSAQENGQAISCEFDHIRYKDPQKVHTYINGIYKKLSDKGFYIITAFYISSEI